jgi:DNA-binding NarL/FixJ family response regulator
MGRLRTLIPRAKGASTTATGKPAPCSRERNFAMIPTVPIRIVVADDSYIIREGVRELVRSLDDIDVVAVCDDADTLRHAIDENHPDVVLTDIRMPPTNTDEGIRMAESLRRTNPDVGVVVLSQYADAEYALALLDKGAAGRAYLLKERVTDLDQLANAIREVSRGGSVIDPKVIENLIAARARQARSPLAELTPRETEVLAEVAQGKNNAAIASGLHLTERAVEKHINSIFSKLGLTEEAAVHRRVRATLIYLAARTPDKR